MIFFRMRIAASTLLQKIINHPFNAGLVQGTLPLARFRSYVEQDALYLNDFVIALSATAERLSELAHHETFKNLIKGVREFELTLHRDYLRKQASTSTPHFFAESPSKLPKKIAAVETYAHHVLQAAREAPVEVSVAALLPCYSVYSELGAHAKSFLHSAHPYQNWIASYASVEFISSAKAIIQIAEELGGKSEHQSTMVSAFVASVQCELNFWESIYPVPEALVASRL